MPKTTANIARAQARRAARRGDIAAAERWLRLAIQEATLDARTTGDDVSHAIARAHARIAAANRMQDKQESQQEELRRQVEARLSDRSWPME